MCDIGSHQIDQFLHFTASDTAKIAHPHVENTTMLDHPGFLGFGAVVLRSGQARGVVWVDWVTPKEMPILGDGRLLIHDTEGQIEQCKYTDIDHPHVTNSLLFVNDSRNELIPCDDAGLPYFGNLAVDVQDRRATAIPQAHSFTFSDLAIQA